MVGELYKKVKKIVLWFLATWPRRILASFLIILFIITPLSFLLFNKKTEAAWFDDNWYYRKAIPLTNNTTAENNVYVSLTLDTSDTTKFQTDCGDLRFTKNNGDLMSYYIYSGCGTASTLVYANFDTFPVGAQTIYYYYGNPSADNGFTNASGSGSVTQANMKMSIANGTSFADFSAGGTLTENLGKKLVITDSASKKLTGYIKAAGTGETYGSELIANGGFDSDTTGWSSSGSPLLDSVAGGQSGNSLKITENGSANPLTYQNIATASGVLYRLSFYALKGTSSAGVSYIINSSPFTQYYYSGNLSPISWTQYTAYGVPSYTSTQVRFFDIAAQSSGQTFFIDSVSFQQIITPSATGVTITSTADGGTYNWASEEGSFNRNDSSNYTYIIYPSAFSTEASNYTVGSLGSEEKSTAPVGYWSFDEGYGGTAHDETSNRNDGTITGATWKPESECVSGKCLGFNGTSDYVSYANQIDISDGLTYSVWFKYIGTPNDNYPLIANKRTLLKIYSNSRIDWWPDVDIPRVSITVPLSENNWYHAAITQTGTTYSFYLNGKLISDGSTNSLDNSSGNKTIGQYNTYYFKGSIDEPKIYPYARTAVQIKQDYNAGLAGTGKAKEGSSVSIGGSSDKWLTDGLVGHWKMDETSGTVVADASGNVNTGTLTNAQETGTSDASGNSTTTLIDTDGALSTTDDVYNGMILQNTSACGGIASGTERLISGYNGSTKTFTVVVAWANVPDSCPYEVRHQSGGKFGNGMRFDGTNDLINAGNAAVLNNFGTGGITVGAWVYVDNEAGNTFQTIIEKGSGDFTNVDSNQKGFFLSAPYQQGAPRTISWRVGDGTGYDNVDYSISNSDLTGKWHHVIGVADPVSQTNPKLRLYVDGALVSTPSSRTETGAIDDNTRNLNIGYWAYASRYFNGTIDDARVYNRALSPGEVQKLYEWAPGPVAHWKMDEKISGDAKTIYDSSGNGNNGTTIDGANNTGMDCSKPGKHGSGCRLDGTDDQIIGSSSNGSLNLKSAVTLEAWVKINAVSPRPSIFCSSPTAYCLFVDSSSHLQMYLRSNEGWTSVTSTNTYTWTDGWHHVAVTYDMDDQKAKLYRDGVLVHTGTRTGIIGRSVTAFVIGMENSNFINGTVDDMRVYNYARTQKQILEDMGGGQEGTLDPGAYYKFDEGYGDTAHNSGLGTSIDGTLNSGGSGGNSTTTAMWDNSGKVGKAVEFDGTNDYVSGPTTNFSASGTISLWFKPSELNRTETLFVYGNSWYADGMVLLRKYNSDDKIHFVVNANTNVDMASNTALVTGTWYHIVATYQNNEAKLFINGAQQGSTDTSCSMPSNLGTTFYIGRQNTSATDYLKGQIDEVKVYNYTLTADDIKADFNRGASTTLGSTGTNSSGAPDSSASREYCVPGDATSCAGPVGEWKMDEKISGNSKTLYDTSSNGNNGTTYYGANSTGMDCTKTGKFGNGCWFDGADDYFNFFAASLPGFNFGSGSFSLGMWIKPESLTNEASIRPFQISTCNDPDSYMLVDIDSSGEISFNGYDSNAINETTNSSVGAVPLNQWSYFYAVMDRTNNQGKVYINGKQSGSTNSLSWTGTFDCSVPGAYASIGGRTENYSFQGSIDQVRVYNYARTPAQIAWDYNKGGPVAEWRFDECQGGTVHDESGNGNNGTINLGASGQTANGTCTDNANTPWYNGRTGKKNAGLNFDGTDDYVNFGDLGVVELTDVTFSFWAKVDVNNKDHDFITKGIHDVSNPLVIWYDDVVGAPADKGANNSDTLSVLVNDGTTQHWVAGTSGSLNNTSWHHIVAVIDKTNSEISIYIDGLLNNSNTKAWGGIQNNSNTLRLGVDSSGGGQPLDGQIDEVKIFNYALTEDQVKTLHNDGAINFR